MAITLFDTYFGKTYNLEQLAKKGAVELQTKMTLDATQDEYLALVKSISPVVKTPISDTFLSIKKLDGLKNITFLSVLNDKATNLPEILTIKDLSIYGKQVGAVSDKRFKGCWANITTTLTKGKDRYAGLSVSGTNELMSIIVRSVMCMAYSDNDVWLNNKASEFLIEFYAKSMATILIRMFSLDVEESTVTKYAFAYYYATLLSNKRDENNAPEILNRCVSLLRNGRVSKEDLDKKMDSIVGKDTMSMDHVATFIVAMGPDRVRGFNSKHVYRALLSSSRNSIATVISADYPPYLVYLLLRTISNDKHPIFTNVINMMYTRQQITAAVDNIIRDDRTFSGIKVNG